MKLEKMGEGRYDVRGTLVGADMRLFPNTRLGLVMGGIHMNGTWEHAATITVLAKGIDRRLEPLLRSGAAAYFSHYFGTLFGPKVSNVSVQF